MVIRRLKVLICIERSGCSKQKITLSSCEEFMTGGFEVNICFKRSRPQYFTWLFLLCRNLLTILSAEGMREERASSFVTAMIHSLNTTCTIVSLLNSMLRIF